MLASGGIYKQRLLHENEIVQLLQKLQKLRHFPKSFYKTLIEFCQERKEQLPLKDPFIFTGRSICN